ncbi:MAG TPA: class I SAM-dependent rRNA methyltransferase [Cytophagaceae bacterium]|nr:class I SAM-dependent rRNA methyltransferase [Cytophagaceae bacterium]
MNYPILQLKPKRERSILLKHPWIFSGGLERRPKASEGEIVEVRSHQNEVLGYGFYSEKSQISCRMFDWQDHPSEFEQADYWTNKIKNALALRKAILPANTDAYRLLHAEGDFLPGVIADVYAQVVVLQILIRGIEQRKELIIEAFKRNGFENVYLKTKSSSQNIEEIHSISGWLSGNGEGKVVAKENDLLFNIDFIDGQKTGFFIDQRDNRQLLKTLSAGKKVLNTFCYTGGFSVYALSGGATEVHSVDISAEAVRLAEENVQLNFPNALHKGFAIDCFDYLKDMPENEYDVIVLDPPAFAKNARAVDNASRGYKQINIRAFKKIKPGGILFTFSCSQNISKDLFQKIVFGAAADVGRAVRIIHQLHQPADHPINIYHPEGEYLKGLVLWVE